MRRNSSVKWVYDQEAVHNFPEAIKKNLEGRSRWQNKRNKYNKNTSTCGTILTENLLNAGRISHTNKATRKILHNRVGQKKKKKELGWDLHPWEGAVEEEIFTHLLVHVGAGS